MLEGREDVVSELLLVGASISSLDRWGRGAAHHAAANGHTKLLASLLAARVTANGPDLSLQTPLHVAAAAGHADTIAALVSDAGDSAPAHLRAKDSIGRAPLHYAAARGYATAAVQKDRERERKRARRA